MPGRRIQGWPRKDRTATIVVRVTPETKKKWEAYLNGTDKGLSLLIRHATSDWIKKHPNPQSLPWEA